MNYKYDVQLMVKVAQMYYTDKCKQEEIAHQLKISRSSVSLILSEALEKGIVEFKVRDPLLNNDTIANKFEELFPIQKCYIIATSIKEADTIRGIVAERAVKILNEIIVDGQNVGLAWGRTCYEFIARYNSSKQFSGVSVFPLIGGSNQTARHFQVNEMVRQLAEKMGGTPFFIHAPAIASIVDREMLMNSSVMQAILGKWRNMDIVVTGIGAPPMTPDFPYGKTGFLPSARPLGEEAFVDNLQRQNAVGDICAQYFDISGQFIKGLSENIIGASQKDLKNAKTVIGLAVGTDKAFSVIGALRTGVINIFVCDEHTALEVLKIAGGK